ncbi:flagellar protein FlaG [Paenibacillus paeoniae]|uniref:Flagellar biosynthesis protein FlaG n=1 Tax=Paenibacillus paeoniae TaxID=2292705 RepID=A0A371P0U2_9BACL|nr:flagellar protein FlaG [Paenibacillus paeoniae]REK69567.1 hypothetical protein DX130_24000 [Paenibacillus paeoniae]
MKVSSINTTAAFTYDTNSNNSPKNGAEELPVNTQNHIQSETLTNEFVKKNIDRILQAVKMPDTEIDRSIHEVTKQVIYKVRDKASGEIIRQFPEEKVVEAAAKLIELTGIMVDQKV